MDTFEICRMVARSLFAEIGPWGNRCALIGGLIPGILVPEPNETLEPHIGTRDVDLAVRVAIEQDDQELYKTLKQNLAALRLEQNKSYEWTRNVEGMDVVVELFVPVTEPGDAGRIQRKPMENSGSGLTALGIYGLELIERDVLEIEDEGPLLDGKGIKKVRLRVCGPTVFIGLKAWALNERTKSKDGYDVVWMLKAQGVENLAQRFYEKGLHETEFGIKALVFLEENFKTYEHTGSVGWVTESSFEGEQASREARDAAGMVQEFVRLVRTHT